MARLAVEQERSIYYEHYRGDNVPIVLLHGYPASGRAWDGQLTGLLARGHEVVVVDQRCCGKSDKDFDDVSISALADDVVALVDALSLRRPVVNGWSLGGGVALMAAIRLGNKAGGLVLTNAAGPRFTQGEDWPYGMTEEELGQTIAGIKADRPTALRGVAESAINADVGEEVIAWLTRIFLECGPRFDEALADLGRQDQRDALRELTIPALVFGGSHDAFVPLEAAEKTAEMMLDATFVPLQDIGHSPFFEDADSYRTALHEFLARIGSISVA